MINILLKKGREGLALVRLLKAPGAKKCWRGYIPGLIVNDADVASGLRYGRPHCCAFALLALASWRSELIAASLGKA